MNLKIIDFETAKDLKKLGFDWTPDPNECGQYYTDDGQLIRNNEALQYKKGISDFYLAPTQAEVAKWLRDKHSLMIDVYPLGYRTKEYVWTVHDLQPWGGVHISDKEYRDFEQAESVGIKKAIEILKERQDDNTTGEKQN